MEANCAEQPQSLDTFIPAGEWRNKRGERFYPSQQSWNWFLRKNRDHLVREGVLRRIAGKDFVDDARIDGVILSLGAR